MTCQTKNENHELRERIAQLEAENRQLCSQVDSLLDDMADLRADNAALRGIMAEAGRMLRRGAN